MAGGPLAQAWRAKYPGAYDNVPDQELEAAIVAKFPGAYDHLIEPAEDPPLTVERGLASSHPAARLATATGQSLRDTFNLARQFVEHPIDTTVAAGRGILQAQFDTYRKAQEAATSGRPLQAALYKTAAQTPLVGPMAANVVERVAGGEGPEVLGEVAADAILGGAGALTLRGARAAFGPTARAARATKKAAALGAQTEGDLLMAVPSAKSAPYTVEDLRAAKPYLNVQAKAAPITTVTAFRDALDAAIGDVEGRMAGYLAAFPEARLKIDADPVVRQALEGNPRGKAFETAMRELEDLPLDRDLDLVELDRLRLQMNAENKAILKKNSYDRATARTVDPGFAAREALANEIRDKLYGYLERRGVEGVRQLRRDEGSMISIRSAAERQTMAGARPVAGTNTPGFVRKAVGELAEKGATVAGAGVGSAFGPIGTAVGAVGGAEAGGVVKAAIRGGRWTRDELIARAFARLDDGEPTFPTVPARRPVAGALPPAPIAASAAPDTSYVRGVPAEAARRDVRGTLPPHREPIITPPGPDTSGRIEPTLPENIANPPKAEMFGLEVAQSLPVEEKAFLARWLADDLREMSFEPGARMGRSARLAEYEKASSMEEFRGATYTPRSPGTPTQEMFHAVGIKGTRKEIAAKLDRYMQTGKGDPKIPALLEAMREAWDGTRFDFDQISDATIAKLGVRRRDLRSPITTPYPDDMPEVYDRWFQRGDEAEAAAAVGRDARMEARIEQGMQDSGSADDFEFGENAPDRVDSPAVKNVAETPARNYDAKDPWYQAHGEAAKAEIFAAMRALDSKVERMRERAEKLAPGTGEKAVGPSHFDAFIEYDARRKVLSGVRNGLSPRQAADEAKAWARGIVAEHNGKRSYPYWKRDEGTADRIIDEAASELEAAIKGAVK